MMLPIMAQVQDNSERRSRGKSMDRKMLVPGLGNTLLGLVSWTGSESGDVQEAPVSRAQGSRSDRINERNERAGFPVTRQEKTGGRGRPFSPARGGLT